MYRLLVVTKSEIVERRFAELIAWESTGYKQPRIRHSVADAIECMHKHHIDAITIDSDVEFQPLIAYLDENYPDIPIFALAEDDEKQRAVIKELDSLLGRLHSDHSDDNYDEAYYFDLAREWWMRGLLLGKVATGKELYDKRLLLRLRDDVDAPCVRADLLAPQGDAYLSGPWHYGSERLETALRNFFGSDYEGMRVRVAVSDPERVRLLITAPTEGRVPPVEMEAVRAYIEETLEQIKQYMGLTLQLTDLRLLDNLQGLISPR